jgi:hypothetical protein
MIDHARWTDEEAREIEDALKRREAEQKHPRGPHEYPPTGKTDAKPLNQPPAPPPEKTDKEVIADLRERVKVLEGRHASERQKLWAEFQVVQDQMRSEFQRFKASVALVPPLPQVDGAAGPEADRAPAPAVLNGDQEKPS